MIAAPLTDLLKKEAFVWTEKSSKSFEELKAAMTSAPVLRLPKFDRTFYVETDASDFGVGAVLLQDGHPIAFFSKKLGPRRRIASTYHKELYAIVEAVQKWRQYLLGREFVIRSDQKSLKELLLQVIRTPDQQFYIRKLMGYKFRIEYKTGASNRAADALSRRDQNVEETGNLFTAFARPHPRLLDRIRAESASLADVVQIRDTVAAGTAKPHWSMAGDLLYFKRRIYISPLSALKEEILREHHSSPIAGHPGVDRTFRRVAASFYWPRMRRVVIRFVGACRTCQYTKYSTQKPYGLLQPLPIPDRVWADVSMDFITGLPTSHGFTAIMVAVDRLSKYAHFAALPTSFDSKRVAALFVQTVVKHHGFPETLVSDRDPIFLGDFWKELLKLSGTTLHFSTAYHPQSDGQTEVRNRGLEQYLRAFTFEKPKQWSTFLPWAELSLNCSHHEGLGMNPFRALYGRDQPTFFPSSPSARTPRSVADLILDRMELLRILKRNLLKAQQRMRKSANLHRRDIEFSVGDLVLLKLRQYRQHSVARPLAAKLARRFYGPFRVLERIGPVAYRLELPVGSKIHNVFHVSLLRPFVQDESQVTVSPLPAEFTGSHPLVQPLRLLNRRNVLRNGSVEEQGLVEWSDETENRPSWEPMAVISGEFPYLLEDKEALKTGGVDTGTTEPPREDDENDEPRVESSDAASQRDDDEPIAHRTRKSRQKPKHLKDYV